MPNPHIDLDPSNDDHITGNEALLLLQREFASNTKLFVVELFMFEVTTFLLAEILFTSRHVLV